MRFFLCTHRNRSFSVTVPEARFLNYTATAFNQIDLAFDFVVDRGSKKAERVDVFQFRARSIFRRVGFADRDVCVAAQTTLVHVAVANIDVLENLFEPLQIFLRFGGRAYVRVSHDFNKRRTAAIEIDMRVAIGVRESFVERLSRVFFHVDSLDPDSPRPAVDFDVEVAVLRKGPVEL